METTTLRLTLAAQCDRCGADLDAHGVRIQDTNCPACESPVTVMERRPEHPIHQLRSLLSDASNAIEDLQYQMEQDDMAPLPWSELRAASETLDALMGQVDRWRESREHHDRD